jgi:hypothetical protein
LLKSVTIVPAWAGATGAKAAKTITVVKILIWLWHLKSEGGGVKGKVQKSTVGP